MPYLVKQKFNILELSPHQREARKVLLIEPEYYLRALIKKLLEAEEFLVACSGNISESKLIFGFYKPDVAVISPRSEKSFETFLADLASLRNEFQGLPILTIGRDLPREIMKQIMDLGVVSHLERNLTRPHDIASVIKTLF